MATTRDYTDYINDQVDIAPTNSQEELQAAELIEGLFVQHGLETQIQEFDAHTFSGVSARVYLILLFIGVLLSGFLGTPASRVGLVLVILSFVLIALSRGGHNPLASIGPMARSQNVIGVHRATGPNVVKGNRPIVIIAHYDTPRENFLNKPQFASWQPLIKRLSWPLSIAALVLAATQAIPAVPTMVLHVLWAIGVLIALPLLMLGAASVYERFANCTTGANDNKASVAAMLGVLDMVRPASDDAKEWAATHPKGVRHEIAEESDADDLYDGEDVDFEELDQDIRDEAASHQESQDADVTYEVDGAGDQRHEESVQPASAVATPFIDEYGLRSPSTKRRGARLLESLEVLPATCEIVYENLIPRDEAIEILDLQRASESGDGAYEKVGGVVGGIGETLGNGLRSAREGARDFVGSIRDTFRGLVGKIKKERELPELEKGDVESAPAVTYVEGQGNENVGGTHRDAYEYDDEYDDPYDDPYESEAYESRVSETGPDAVARDDSFASADVHNHRTQEFQVPHVTDTSMPTLVDMRVPEVVREEEQEPNRTDSDASEGYGDARFRQPLTFEVEQEAVAPAEALPQDGTVFDGSRYEQPAAQHDNTDDALEVTGAMSRVETSTPVASIYIEKDDTEASAHQDDEAAAPATVDDEKPVDEPDEDAGLWTPVEIVDVDVDFHQEAEELPGDSSGEHTDDVRQGVDTDGGVKDSSKETEGNGVDEVAHDVDSPKADDSWKDKVAIREALTLDDYPEISSGMSGTEVLSALVTENAAVAKALESNEGDGGYAPSGAYEDAPFRDDQIDIDEMSFEDNPWKHVSLVYVDADYVVIDETMPFEQAPVEVVEVTSPTLMGDYASQPLSDEPLYEESYEELYEGEYSNEAAGQPKDDASARDAEVVDVEPEQHVGDAMVDETVQDTEDVIYVESGQRAGEAIVDEPVRETQAIEEVEPEQNEPEPQSNELDNVEQDHEETMGAVEPVVVDQPLEEEPQEAEGAATNNTDSGDVQSAGVASEETIVTEDVPVEEASVEEEANQKPVFDVTSRPVFTPSYIDEIDDPEESELETTLTFKTLSQEDIDAHKAKLEQADSEASSVLHQMFASVPKQERYEEPRTTDVLHEMFSAMPSIEPIPTQEQDQQRGGMEEQERTLEDEASDDATGEGTTEPTQRPEELEEHPEAEEHLETEISDVTEDQPAIDEQVIEESRPVKEPQPEESTEAKQVPDAPVEAQTETESSSDRLSILDEIPLAQWETVEDVQESDEELPHEQGSDEPITPAEELVASEAPIEFNESREVDTAEDDNQTAVDEVKQEQEVERAESDNTATEKPKFWFEKRPVQQDEAVDVNPEQAEPAAGDMVLEPTEAVDEGLPLSEEPMHDGIQLEDVAVEEHDVAPQTEADGSSQDDSQKLMPGITFSTEPEVSEEELEEKDITGLTTISIETEADVEDSIPQVEERIPKPRAIDDPNWGRSSFKPTLASAGRRAMLLDLPDPSVMAVSSDAPGHAQNGSSEAPDAVPELVSRRLDVLHRVPSPLDDSITRTTPEAEQIVAEGNLEAPAQNKVAASERKSLRERLSFTFKREDEAPQQESMSDWLGLDSDYDAKKDGRQIGSWDNFEDKDKGKWKGGATLRSGLRDNDIDDDMVEEESGRRPFVGLPNFDSLDLMPNDDDEHALNEVLEDVVEGQLEAEVEQELREAVLHLGDDDLIAHDIWFVGVGASSLDHAGIKAFLDEHRRDIRGAFLVNLDSVGAGDLTLLTHEGMGEKRRGDRRMARMLGNIADALHIKLGRADYSWDETDATPALQRSVRVATLMGMSAEGVPANSHTADDEPEYLDDRQIADVADIVAQLIREA